jgi:branched-chain amino acid aminotransferase
MTSGLTFLNYNNNIIPEEQAPQLLPQSVFRSKEGLFESMLLIENKIQLIPLHFARLEKGIKQLNYAFPFPFDISFFEEAVLKTAKANSIYSFGRIRFQVFKDINNSCSFIVEVFPMEASVFEYNEIGWKLGLVNNDWKNLDENASLKSINPNLYTSTLGLVKENGWNDLLLVNDGFISESGTANFFIVRDEVVFTPPIAQGCIAGVMRTHVLASIHQMGLKCFEKPISTEMLLQADEVFLTNAVRRIKWVSEIDKKKFFNNFSFSLSKKLFYRPDNYHL